MPIAAIKKSIWKNRLRSLVLPSSFLFSTLGAAQQLPTPTFEPAVTLAPTTTIAPIVTTPKSPMEAPVQYQGIAPNVQPAPAQQDNSKLPAELLAILQSVFGMGSRGSILGSAQNCVGSSEIACVDGGARESYSTESFANIRPTATSDLNSPFRILGPFKKYFDGCIEKAGLGMCRFVNLGIKGDVPHQRRRSCHNSAQAIDVGPLTCSSGRRILASDPKYFEVAKCMANQTNNELQVIFYKSEGPNMIQKSDHNNHMHIQLKNCSMVYG